MPLSGLAVLTEYLPEQHAKALAWFDSHAGRIMPWPSPLPDGTFLATKAKGIYKPQWSDYALSVRQSLTGQYPDSTVEDHPDGTWTYNYFQESLELNRTDDFFTNRGLLNCYRDVVPVGVIIQTRGKPEPRYLILGLGLISGFEDGLFCLQGYSINRLKDVGEPQLATGHFQQPQARADAISCAFDPTRVDDERRRVLALITSRRGQSGFRRTLLNAYDNKCSVTAYDAEDALEAAHIVPYRGPVTNHPTNGILLRADLHSLFDLGLITVDVDRRNALILGGDLRTTSYRGLEGSVLRLPADPNLRPSMEALREHRRWAEL